MVEFILNTRERLRHAIDVATEHAANERTKAKLWYDRRACEREFEPGEKVLVLLHVQGKPLEAKFHGPYLVTQHLGPVDYVISTPDRRKTKRVCHVNLIKKYVECDPRLIEHAVTTPSDVMMDVGVVPDELVNCRPLSDSPCDLTVQQQSELNDILAEFSDGFSDVPEKTNMAVHHIQLQPNTQPVRCTPYRLDSEMTPILRQELLRPPNYSLLFCMSVDASTGSVLFQTVEGIDHPICFYSKKLDSHQRHYSTIEEKALSLVLSFRVFSVYLDPVPSKFTRTIIH